MNDNSRTDLRELLNYINPASLDYTQWTAVGMALKLEGYSSEDWDSWSAKDAGRYKAGECARKWETFRGNEAPVTGGSIYQMAYDQGWRPDQGQALEWDSLITQDDETIIDPGWIEAKDIKKAPREKFPSVKQIIRYIETLFEQSEYVGYVMKSSRKTGNDGESEKWIPADRGSYSRTAGELIDELKKYGNVDEALGSYTEEAGAWIRFNPLDGEGVANKNVASYRYALVESDDMELEKQNAMIRELNLPVACLVYSGGKSLHAIVRIDAQDYDEYKKRVKYLYDICRKNGMSIDGQNKNPSRLSRLPGVLRGKKKQYIIDTNIGTSGWDEWIEWYENETDDLPNTESLDDLWENMPQLAPELIEGILRDGHKMLIAGPSKAGKSFLLIELCIAVAEGRTWLGRRCGRGDVLYVNLELDRVSCMHRFKDVYDASGIKPENLGRIDIWNLRGRSVPMDKLAPRLIRRARKKNYKLIVIDPIYKVLTGDENSAEQMSKFCNQFDKICTDLGCAVVYCHHHSKGTQGQKKSADRASGSGVFARDPDAMLDMIELPLTEDIIKQERNKIECSTMLTYLKDEGTWMTYREELSQDDMLSSRAMSTIAENKMHAWDYSRMMMLANKASAQAAKKTAWRIEATLREFATPAPINMWFDYPVHRFEDVDMLMDLNPESDRKLSPDELKRRRQKGAKKSREEQESEFEIAFENLADGGKKVSLSDMSEVTEISKKTIGLWLGKGKQSRENLKKRYRKTGDPGGVSYIEKIENE